MKLIAYNPSTDGLEKSYLSQAYPVGATSLVTRNTNNISVGDKILIGEMGREKSEIVTVSAVNADKITLTVGATAFSHSADDPVYDLRYDTIRFYRSTTGITGGYSLLTAVTVDVDNADKNTYYNDTLGLSTYYYKISYYNTPGSIESQLSDPMPGEGYARTQLGSIISDFLEEASDIDQTYTNIPQAIAWMNECSDDLSSQSNRPYRFLRKNPNWTLSTTAGNNRVALPDDLTFIDFIQYNYDYNGFLSNPEIEIIGLNEMNYLISRNSAFIDTDDALSRVAIDSATNELVLYPTPTTSQTNVITIYGWTGFTEFNTLGDSVQTPNSRIYKMFLLSKFWQVRSIKDGSNNFKALAGAYRSDYGTEIVKLQRANKIDKGTPTGMKPDTRNNLRLRGYYGYGA